MLRTLGRRETGQCAHFLLNVFFQIDLIYILKTFALIYNKKYWNEKYGPTLIGYDLYK